MVDTLSILDDLLQKISSLKQEFDKLQQAEQLRKQTEKTLFSKNRFSTLLNTIRSGLIEYNNPEDIYDNVCRSFVQSGFIRTAWIGEIDFGAKAIRTAASADIDDEKSGIYTSRIPDEILLMDIIIDTIRRGELFLSNDIKQDIRLQVFQDAAENQKYRSLAALPIGPDGHPRAVLALFSEETNFFSDLVIRDLHNICRELATSLERILRQSNLNREIEGIKNDLMRYQQISDENIIGIAVVQRGKFVYVNNALSRIFGYSVDELLRWEQNGLTRIIHPDDVQYMTDPKRRTEQTINGITAYSYRIITKEGAVRKIRRYSKTIFYGDEHAYLIAVIDTAIDPRNQEASAEPEKRIHFSDIPEMNIYELIFTANPYPMLLIDFDTFSIIKTNNAAVSQYGYSDSELMKMSIRDLMPVDEIQPFIERIVQLPLAMQMEIMTRHRLRDNTVIDVEVTARYIRYYGKTVVLIISRDVTNTKWAEDVIRESEANYRNIFNSVGYMLFVIDRKARILDINAAAAFRLQRQREDVIGKDFGYINSGDKNSDNLFDQHLKRVFEVGEEQVEWWIRRSDGENLHVHMVLHRGIYFGHDVVVVAGRLTDADTGRSRSPELISAALEWTPTALAIANGEGAFTWANQAFTSLTGYGTDRLVDNKFDMLQAEKGNGDFIRKIWETVGKGRIWKGETTIRRKDNTNIDISLSITPIKFKDEPVSRYVISAKNLSEEKERIQNMLQIQKMESIDTISRAIAHDFNNILGIILGYTSFLEKRKDDPEKLHADVVEIKTAVQRGANLIKQMISYTHRNEISYEEIDVNDSVQKTAMKLGETIPPEIKLTLNLSEGIPPILMGQNQFNQIINELCLNARDAIMHPGRDNPGRGDIYVETSIITGDSLSEIFPAANENKYVEIRVRDTGIGMNESTKNRVFDPFFTEKDYGKGKGLGLTAVYGNIKSYDGFIRVESEIKQGSTFIVYLPVKDGQREKRDSEVKHDKTEPIVMTGNKILVIEDEPSLLQLLFHALEDSGYSVLTAHDGIEGVRMYEKHKDEIALVISDVGLPKLDGFNAYLQMRRINPRVQAILASGYLDDKVKADLSKEGIKDFIMKPYKTEVLLAKVKEYVKNTT